MTCHSTQDFSYSGLEGYETKDIENVWLNNFDDNKGVLLDQKEYLYREELILTDQLIDAIMKHNDEITTEVVANININLSQIDVLINYLSLLFWLKIILASSSGMS